ncbi:MAG: AbrB/MazE/SpoVT family DNA-binding domain-containing protein [Lachnospiraceae bacterium]|nr:AbrB/MazE/SpoVT family DNA-binding domain-containing protein [Lachnospiraceae bacterium]
MKSIIVDNAKVMSKGQITLPKEVRLQLGVDTGDKVIFIAEGDRVIMMNAAVYAMKILQSSMEGEREKSGLFTDDDINALIKEIRNEVENP